MRQTRQTNIFLIEDNPGDIKLITSQLKSLLPDCNITTAHDGEEALHKLVENANATKSFPDLIIMDLNLPKMTGHELLKEIKKEAKLRAIPVVIFSSSASPKDIITAYENHGNCYIVKPFDYHEFNEAIKQACDFWFNVSKLPNQLVA
jgi:CheY-like chemotaxis protein